MGLSAWEQQSERAQGTQARRAGYNWCGARAREHGQGQGAWAPSRTGCAGARAWPGAGREGAARGRVRKRPQGLGMQAQQGAARVRAVPPGRGSDQGSVQTQ